MTTPVYGAHEAKAYYVVESTYGVTPTNPSMTGLATAENVEPDLNPSLIRVRSTGSRDLQTIRKGLRQVGLKIAYNLPSASPIDFLLHVQTLNSLTVEVVYEKSSGIIDLLYTGCRFNSLTVECSVEDLVKALEKDLQPETVNLNDVNIEPSKPLIDTAGKNFHEGLTLLSRVGLNDAFLFVRRYSQLSDGQKYRYRLAKIIESDKKYWFADEFCSTLDRDTAKIVAFNIQKIAREEGQAVFAATTHTDLLQDLKPSIHIHKRFGKEIQVHYYPNTANRECSIVKQMRIEEGTKADYKKLAHFHYRDSRVFVHHKIFAMKRYDETVGAIVYGSPPLAVTGRRKAIGKKLTIQEINRDIIRISRVVIHPKYCTIGLGAKLVAETLPLAGKPYVETIAVMAKYNPFFEKAGMTKIAETQPNPQVQKVVEKLRTFNFNPVFLTSEKANLNKLQQMTEKEVEGIRAVIKEVTGIYRKRIAGTKQAFLNKEEYGAIVDAAGTTKLAKMIRILGFLTQTKVYLFWKNK